MVKTNWMIGSWSVRFNVTLTYDLPVTVCSGVCDTDTETHCDLWKCVNQLLLSLRSVYNHRHRCTTALHCSNSYHLIPTLVHQSTGGNVLIVSNRNFKIIDYWWDYLIKTLIGLISDLPFIERRGYCCTPAPALSHCTLSLGLPSIPFILTETSMTKGNENLLRIMKSLNTITHRPCLEKLRFTVRNYN